MALVAPQYVIEAPSRAPFPYGLFSVAPPVDSPGFPWEQGVTWTDQACEALPPALVADCAAPEGFPKNLDTGLSQGASAAFTIYGDFVCSPIGFTPEQAQFEADRRLMTREEQAVTAQAASLLVGGGTGALAGTDLTGSLADIESAVPVLEQHLAVEHGSQGVLLVTLESLYALDDSSVVRVGTGLQTRSGTPIAVERTGTVAGFDIGIIPTPLLYRSEVFASSNRPGDLLDRNTNDLHAVAERSYVLGWVPCGGAYVALA